MVAGNERMWITFRDFAIGVQAVVAKRSWPASGPAELGLAHKMYTL